MRGILTTCLTLFSALSATSASAQLRTEIVEYYGYDDCLLMQNGTTRVTVCPAAGGRVLEYSLDGTNALYLPPGDEGWTAAAGGRGAMHAGRFDIGPEQMVPRRPRLWSGRWTGQIVAPLHTRVVSQKDDATGVQLTRDFQLDPASSRLRVTQTIHNISNSAKEYCHWSRTFAVGGGICVVPLEGSRRFPNGYVMYESSKVLNFRPEDENIRARDGFLEILAPPQHPKLGMDTQAGWMAYLMPHDVMFVKRYPVDAKRVYNEVAGLTMSVWYPDHGRMCELEPIGPAEPLAPGESAAFTETWWLLPRSFPADGEQLDLKAIAQTVARQAK